MMHTYQYQSENYGKVVLNTNSDHSGIASLAYDEKGERKYVELPAELLMEIGVKSAIRHLKVKLIEFVESLPDE